MIESNGPFQALVNGREIRRKPLDWPPIPDGCSLHNPDNLTPEQVGDRWRLLVLEEHAAHAHPNAEYFHTFRLEWSDRFSIGTGYSSVNTYRVPISTPFPDGSKIVDGKLVKPEPEWIDVQVAEALKKELKPGQKVIWREAFRWKDDNGVLSNHYESQSLAYIAEEHGYTIIKDAGCAGIIVDKNWKPWTLSRHIPGFRPLRDGEEWHREDWTEEMLPEGWRPLILGIDKGDYEVSYDKGRTWSAGGNTEARVLSGDCAFMRTKRPLPEPKKRVPLGPSDIRPGNVFRYKSMREGLWAAPSEVGHDGLLFWSYKGDGTEGESYHVSWEKLMSYERSNDGINWTPCFREE